MRAVSTTDSRVPRADRGDGRLPCSPAQERLWFLEQVDPGSPAHVTTGAVRFTGDLDLPVLRRCLDEIVRRHEVLRTNVVERNGTPYQVVSPPAPVPLPVRDIRDAPDIGRAIDDAGRREAATAFDLATAPLLRASLLRVDDRAHVLLLTVHQVACDGWSIGVLRAELAALYEAFRDGRPSPLPELPVQYGDVAVWQRARLGRGELDAQREHWRTSLAGVSELPLPTDKSRSVARTSRGDATAFRLSPDLVASVGGVAAEAGTTRFAVLLAAFAAVLWRWSGQDAVDTVVIGSPVSGRFAAETEPMVGLFVNTLPLRLDLSGDPAFAELVAAAREECAAARANQDYPFDRMVADSGADRSDGLAPLVQVVLTLRDAPPAPRKLGGLVVEELPVRSVSTKYDLALDLVASADGGLDGRLEFSTDLFTRDTAARMADAFARLLRHGLSRPHDAVSALPLITQAESARITGELSGHGSTVPFEGPLTLHGMFERWADRTPDATAVVSGQHTLTYAELDARANRLAHHLRALGVVPEQLVGVSLPRSELMVVAVLGILKAGAGYVPLDPGYPRSRVACMAQDAKVPVILTHSSVTIGDFDDSVRFVRLDTELPADLPVTRPGVHVHGAGLAYVIYTSGSTGLPMGSANEHARVVNTLHGVNNAYDLTREDRVLAISSLNYDMSVYEVFGTLSVGATVVVPSDAECTDPGQLLDLLARREVTAWSSAPALLDALVGHASRRGGMPGVRLRVVGLGGDRMPAALPGRLAEMIPGVRLLNLAGMTESSYCSLAHRLTRRTCAGGVPWGRPFAGHRIYVLDRHGRPAPVGVPGELFIGGSGPGRGYWQRPGLTADRFRPDPYSPEPGGRMYATGDHARFLANGDVEFLGRLDQQIKIRGFLVEPGEIEAELATHPAVSEPVVIAFDDGLGERRLAAYVLPRGRHRPSSAELRAYLAALLPDHMVPSVYVVLDRFPLLPSGKLDRAALPAPAGAHPRG